MESKTSTLISEIYKRNVHSPEVYLIKVSDFLDTVVQKNNYENINLSIKLIKLFKLLIQSNQFVGEHKFQTQKCIEYFLRYFVICLENLLLLKKSKITN